MQESHGSSNTHGTMPEMRKTGTVKAKISLALSYEFILREKKGRGLTHPG
jgi:hypothetical protein